MHSRKLFLFHWKEWEIKQDRNKNFDVPIECICGAEMCDLVGAYILSEKKKTKKKRMLVCIATMAIRFLGNFQAYKLNEGKKK